MPPSFGKYPEDWTDCPPVWPAASVGRAKGAAGPPCWHVGPVGPGGLPVFNCLRSALSWLIACGARSSDRSAAVCRRPAAGSGRSASSRAWSTIACRSPRRSGRRRSTRPPLAGSWRPIGRLSGLRRRPRTAAECVGDVVERGLKLRCRRPRRRRRSRAGAEIAAAARIWSPRLASERVCVADPARARSATAQCVADVAHANAAAVPAACPAAALPLPRLLVRLLLGHRRRWSECWSAPSAAPG